MMASQTIKTNGGKILQETSASGAKGMLLRTNSPEKFFFAFIAATALSMIIKFYTTIYP